MSRSIRVLYNFAPPTTKEEIRAAALQYVREVSGVIRRRCHQGGEAPGAE